MKRIILFFLFLLIVVPEVTNASQPNPVLKEQNYPQFLMVADLETQGDENESIAEPPSTRSQAMDDMLLFFEEADLIVTATKQPPATTP